MSASVCSIISNESPATTTASPSPSADRLQRERLAIAHLDYALRYGRMFASRSIWPQMADEFAAECGLILWKAILVYRMDSLTPIRIHLDAKLRNGLLDYCRHIRLTHRNGNPRRVKFVPFPVPGDISQQLLPDDRQYDPPDPVVHAYDARNVPAKLDAERCLAWLREHGPGRSAAILELQHRHGLLKSEIAENLGISPGRVSQIVKKAGAALRELAEKDKEERRERERERKKKKAAAAGGTGTGKRHKRRVGGEVVLFGGK